MSWPNVTIHNISAQSKPKAHIFYTCVLIQSYMNALVRIQSLRDIGNPDVHVCVCETQQQKEEVISEQR